MTHRRLPQSQPQRSICLDCIHLHRTVDCKSCEAVYVRIEDRKTKRLITLECSQYERQAAEVAA